LDTTATGGLDQGAAGLFIKAGGVTNTQLVNSTFTLNGDTGTPGPVSLGGTIEIAGDSAQGIVTNYAAGTFTVTASDATSSQKGVASFDATNFTVTAGAVSLAAGGVDLTTDVSGILPVANGGTGVNTLGANQVMIGNTTSPVLTSSALTFASGLLTVGGASPLTIDGATGTISSTATDADINLVPNGNGSVVIGPAGAGIIQSDTGFGLTVTVIQV
jgi:hypothetical protein